MTCAKALVPLVTVLLLAMPSLAQKHDDDWICNDHNLHCNPIQDVVRMVLGDPHPPVHVVPAGLWSSKSPPANINTQRALGISALAYAIVEREKIAGIMMSAETFQTTILILGKHERTEKKFDTDASIRSLCEVRGFLHGWEAAQAMIRPTKKRHTQNYSKSFQCGA